MKQCRQASAIAALFISLCLSMPLYAFDFSQWDAMLKKNTRTSNYAGIGYTGFDYAAILNSREFDKLVGGLESFSPEELRGREETLAFWINVYNIFAVKLVRDHFPVTGIKDVGSIFSPVWSAPAGKVGGKTYSLNDIEHKILRPMNEPAIHFAIVCASVSCPDMRPEAYTVSALNGQLKSQINRFLENREKGMRVDRENKTVFLSMIFDWYEKDFAGTGGIIGFLNSEPGGSRNIPADYKIKYLPYNWDLNTVR
ncbi:MAG: DUF547 domain-containing protein [Gallionella sp.]|nr:DUF547 domain-containing protein [Gallionella sp.]